MDTSARTPMTDSEYTAARSALQAAQKLVRETEEAVLEEAVLRGEAYIIRGYRFYEAEDFPFLTREEALEFVESDQCSVTGLIEPTATE